MRSLCVVVVVVIIIVIWICEREADLTLVPFLSLSAFPPLHVSDVSVVISSAVTKHASPCQGALLPALDLLVSESGFAHPIGLFALPGPTVAQSFERIVPVVCVVSVGRKRCVVR